MDIASREYQESKTASEIAHDIDWLVSMALNPPAWLRMTDYQTGELKTLFTNMLEALHCTKSCGLNDVQIAAYLLRRNGMSLRATGRRLGISHNTVRDHCVTVNQYASDYLASHSD